MPTHTCLCVLVLFAVLVSPARAGGEGAIVDREWLLEPPPAGSDPAAGAPTAASTGEPPQRDDRVGASLAFVLWAPGTSGDVSVGATKVAINQSFIETIEEADTVFGLDARLEIGTRRFGGFVEGFYTDLGFEDRESPAGRVTVSSQMAILDFGLRYRFLDRTMAAGDATAAPRRVGLDVYGGGRYAYLGVDFDLESGADISKDESWLDPLIGLRGDLELSERWRLTAGGDVGGFGVGSDFTWSAIAAVDYRFELGGTGAALTLGYKAISEDYSTDSGANAFEWDVILHGPIIAFTLRF